MPARHGMSDTITRRLSVCTCPALQGQEVVSGECIPSVEAPTWRLPGSALAKEPSVPIDMTRNCRRRKPSRFTKQLRKAAEHL